VAFATLQLIIVFRGDKHNGNWFVSACKDYVMGVAQIMDKNKVGIVSF